MDNFRSFLGIIIILIICFVFSSKKTKVSFKTITIGLILQCLLALLLIGVPALGFNGPLKGLFVTANDFLIQFLTYANAGSEFLFGELTNSSKHGFIFAFHVLPAIIFFTALTSLGYYLGILQFLIKALATLTRKTLGTSGPESMVVAANVFIGQIEAPTVVKPYLDTMTKSQLFLVMTAGFATVSGSILVGYVNLLKDIIPDIAGHLVTASLLSAPAAVIIAKTLEPDRDEEVEQKTPESFSDVNEKTNDNEAPPCNSLEAIARGTREGLYLALNIAAMLIVFVSLVSLTNGILSFIGEGIGFRHWTGSYMPSSAFIDGNSPELSVQFIFGIVSAPFAYILGIPTSDLFLAGSILGNKIALNEFVAYIELSKIADQLTPRSQVILTYALCGFANFSSIGIQIGGIGTLAPKRSADLAKIGMKAMFAGTLAALMTACVAGMLI